MKKVDLNAVKDIQKNKKDVTIVNVLTKDAFEKEHIPGSENIPLGNDFVEQAEDQLDKSDKILLHCQNASCPASRNAATKLEKAGFSNVMVYEGGIDEWKDSGEKVESGERKLKAA